MDGFLPQSLTAATLTLDARQANTVVNVNRAAGSTITLPAATGTGRVYIIVVGTTITSNNLIVQAASANDFMQGMQFMLGSAVAAFATAATSDTITMNGTTTGGVRGDRIVLTDMVANTGSANTGMWQVNVTTGGSGTAATVFSSAV